MQKKKSRRGHTSLSLVYVVCCVGNGFCDELITRSAEFYRVCVSNCVSLYKTQKWGGLGQSWAVTSQKKSIGAKNVIHKLIAKEDSQDAEK